MKISNRFHIVIVALVFAACDIADHQANYQPEQLVNQLTSFKCSVDTTRAAALRVKYQSMVVGSDSTWQQRAFETLALVPDEYLRVIFEDYKAPITLWSSGGGLTTQTVRGGQPPDRPYRSEKIMISRGQPHYFGLLHEVGHAIQPEIDRIHKTFFKSFRYWFEQAATLNSSESQHMWSYPKSATSEYWAETFDSYYCSPESREHMRLTYPRSYQFAKRYLIDPAKLGALSSSTSASLRENEPAGDEDGDGIANASDKCVGTSAADVTKVRQDEAYAGCAPGEFTDQIGIFLQ